LYLFVPIINEEKEEKYIEKDEADLPIRNMED